MAMRDWIDHLARLFALPYDGGTNNLTVYQPFQKAEWPTSLDVPCALTLPQADGGDYSTSEGAWGLYSGTIEFHLLASTDPKGIQQVFRYWDVIIETAAQNIGLNNPSKIVFLLSNDEGPRLELATFEFGQDAPHLGLLARWTVREEETERTQVSLEP